MLVEGESDSRTARLAGLDAEYYDDPDKLTARMETFARKHGLV